MAMIWLITCGYILHYGLHLMDSYNTVDLHLVGFQPCHSSKLNKSSFVWYNLLTLTGIIS